MEPIGSTTWLGLMQTVNYFDTWVLLFSLIAADVNGIMYPVGYIPAHNWVYVADKSLNIYGYSLSLSYVEYQTAILWGDLNATAEILPTIPIEQRNKLAWFLESQGNVLRVRLVH